MTQEFVPYKKEEVIQLSLTKEEAKHILHALKRT